MTSSNKLKRGALILLFGLSVTGFAGSSIAATEGTSFNLPVEKVADYLYALIEADREVYTKHVVERLQNKGVVVASENWEEKNTLPLPAQFLMESGRVVAKKGLGLQYRLISLWPINKRNGASSEFEKIGLGTILTHPTKPYTAFVKEEEPVTSKLSIRTLLWLRLASAATIPIRTAPNGTSRSMTLWGEL